jgi:hypothetical protein
MEKTDNMIKKNWRIAFILCLIPYILFSLESFIYFDWTKDLLLTRANFNGVLSGLGTILTYYLVYIKRGYIWLSIEIIIGVFTYGKMIFSITTKVFPVLKLTFDSLLWGGIGIYMILTSGYCLYASCLMWKANKKISDKYVSNLKVNSQPEAE